MKKIVCFCVVVLAMMIPASVYASNVRLFDDPPKRGTTTFGENCRDQGVTYSRKNALSNKDRVEIKKNSNVDVNMTVNSSNGTSYSKDTRSNWPAEHNRNYEQKINTSDNVDIRCYPRNQK